MLGVPKFTVNRVVSSKEAGSKSLPPLPTFR
jgi:hypothetical protein